MFAPVPAMTASHIRNQWLVRLAGTKTGRTRWLLWSLVTSGALFAGCTEAEVGDPPPASCDVYRIDSVRPPDDADNRAAAILAAVFRTYEEHDLPGAWQTHLDERLATDLVWTIELGGCAEPDAIPLGALADIGSMADGADGGWHPATDVDVRVWFTDRELGGRIDGELDAGYAPVIADAFVPFLDALLAAGDTSWGSTIDTGGDGRIDRDELLADPLFQILTRPDRGDRLSFGFDVHATWVGTAP
jgi:hypothetical protein